MVNFSFAAGNQLHGAHRVDPCGICAVRDIAACSTLDTDERRQLASIKTVLEFNALRFLFDEGEPANFVFTVTEGVIKIYKTLPDGRRQVTGFLFPGDFLGLVGTSTYAYSAETLTPSRLCRFAAMSSRRCSMHCRFRTSAFGMASHEIAAARDRMVLLGRKSAANRSRPSCSCCQRAQGANSR
jgi:CRP/FNR family transcriptional regulator